MKKIIFTFTAFILSTVIMAGVTVFATNESLDINGDGIISDADVVAIQESIGAMEDNYKVAECVAIKKYLSEELTPDCCLTQPVRGLKANKESWEEVKFIFETYTLHRVYVEDGYKRFDFSSDEHEDFVQVFIPAEESTTGDNQVMELIASSQLDEVIYQIWVDEENAIIVTIVA